MITQMEIIEALHYDPYIEALAEQWENDIKYYAKMHTLYCQRRYGASGRNVSRALKEMSACHAKELRDLLETKGIKLSLRSIKQDDWRRVFNRINLHKLIHNTVRN